MKKTISLFLALFSAVLIHSNEKAIIEGMSFMASSPTDIKLDLDAFKKDSYSMALCDYLLENPEKSEFETENLLIYMRNLSFSKAYRYCDLRESTKKKPKKCDWSDIITGYENQNMEFMINEEIADSDYYKGVRKFLKNADSRKDNSKTFTNMAECVDYLLSLSEEKLNSEIESIRKSAGDKLQIIIGTENDDTHRISKENVLIIDFKGNDVYIAENGYSLACGINSISGVIDFHGDDIYEGKSFDIGCGINGIGFIDDRDGNDSYSSKHGAMGAGFCGMGFILDRSGNDSYTGSGFCQGFGFTKGMGFIYDISGDDSYIARNGFEDHREESYHAHLSQGFGYGVRDIASGGIGIILDESGDDLYSGEYFVQGSSYWKSLGILYDNSGNDVYKSRRYSQGAGTHFTTGLLFDRTGDDMYHSWGVSQGCGHDFSFGMLTDYSGNDLYYSNWLSQGAGNANGTGMLIDFEGDDSYKTNKTDCQGWANPLRNTFSYGMLFDMKGRDSFKETNASTRVKTRMGVLIDKD